FVINNNIKFREEISLMEDLIFCIELFVRTKSIAYDKSTYYHYITNEGSALNSYRENTMRERIRVIEILQDIFNEFKIIKLKKEKIKYRYIRMAIISISYEVRAGNNKSTIKKLKSIKNICDDFKLNQYLYEIDIKKYDKKTRILLKSI